MQTGIAAGFCSELENSLYHAAEQRLLTACFLWIWLIFFLIHVSVRARRRWRWQMDCPSAAFVTGSFYFASPKLVDLCASGELGETRKLWQMCYTTGYWEKLARSTGGTLFVGPAASWLVNQSLMFDRLTLVSCHPAGADLFIWIHVEGTCLIANSLELSHFKMLRENLSGYI